MKSVMLERNALGLDVDVSCFEDFGPVTVYPESFVAEVAERVGDAECVILNKLPMNEATLGSCPNVKLILESATGTDNIDKEYCRKRGIAVANVAGYSTMAVAQHTFALYFYIAEHLAHYDHFVKDGLYGSQRQFCNYDVPFNDLEGKTWGIIGMGNIGRQVAKSAELFGCKIICYSASGRKYDTEYEQVDFDTLLKESDIISIHAPLNEHTKYLIDMNALKKMKKTAYLINVGRGPIVNNSDLAVALNEGIIKGAGLDVLDGEPITPENPLGKIKDSDKLIITPHMAWASVEARTRLVKMMHDNGKRFLSGDTKGFVVE